MNRSRDDKLYYVSTRATVSFILMMVLLSSCSIFNEWGTLPNSEADALNEVSPYNFPLELYCAEAVEGTGPSWENITIGSSTLGELAETLFQRSKEYEVYSEENEVRFSIFDRTTVRDTDIPTTVTVCIIDDIVIALAVAHNLSSLPDLNDYIVQYGEPDAVTWSDFETSRVVLWFEEGIVANVGVADSGFGVITTVYMPYQSAVGFETKWPYNRTRTMPPLAGDEVFIPPLPTEQNPFNFDAMIATITAEPNFSPTSMETETP
jgi:hypothetical protein